MLNSFFILQRRRVENWQNRKSSYSFVQNSIFLKIFPRTNPIFSQIKQDTNFQTKWRNTFRRWSSKNYCRRRSSADKLWIRRDKWKSNFSLKSWSCDWMQLNWQWLIKSLWKLDSSEFWIRSDYASISSELLWIHMESAKS